jgi:hypothetical protein
MIIKVRIGVGVIIKCDITRTEEEGVIILINYNKM